MCLTISTNGRCFDIFLQKSKICISTDVEVLFNEKFSENELLFFATILKLEQNKWGYGRKPKSNKIFNTKINLPTINGEIDWKFINKYIEKIKEKELIRLISFFD